MGSIEHLKQHSSQSSIYGEFMHPVITSETTNGDPWKRNYFAPPAFKPLVPRKYPLTDIRAELSSPGHSSTNFLKENGFSVVNHHSHFLEKLAHEEDLSEDAIAQTYHPEIITLVKDTLGCKHVFTTNTVFRRGKRAPEAYTLPTARPAISTAVPKDEHKLSRQAALQLAAPVRVPHMDYTPLGARQAIRSESTSIHAVAQSSGIIAAEDAIYPSPTTKASDGPIAAKYNPGPRYAAFSIWRPLKLVTRDPLALSPRAKGRPLTTGGEHVHHFYENRIPGPAELRGDFLKEYAMLGVSSPSSPSSSPSSSSAERPDEESAALKWYYVSEQKPEEVLFIKLFDSAALGEKAEHAPAPWHASPEIGSESEEPRESIDVRILVFW